ncbi:hypothetical protein [Zunongwangia pacifica]|uniref:TonB family protein n=1 Tax=Zunongwangia pacifica TaxID=2911062 RepID=A0A9X2A1S8_9FLAO|nr:hypothetical protein [Zunongwangia pacifica]MCL6220481.1 hypothetical protein [Zunongwangia pacifica]
MQFIEKHKALLLTILVFLVLFLALYNWHLGNSARRNQEFLVDLDSFTESLKQKEEEPAPEKQPEPTNSKTQTHRAFDQNNEAREANFDKQLNDIFQKNSASQTEISENSESNSSGDYAVGKSGKKAQERSDGDNSNKTTSTKRGSLRNSSISFNLKGRSAVDIPNPIYTCSVSGKIVINIRVNESGHVIAASFNEASSSTDNKCLVENALLYASEAIFSELTGRNNQPGTITYQFKP